MGIFLDRGISAVFRTEPFISIKMDAMQVDSKPIYQPVSFDQLNATLIEQGAEGVRIIDIKFMI